MTTQRYIALLGGINVGGHRVKMADLRVLFETLGYTNVATVIASGNVIFETVPTDPMLLQTRIEQKLGDVLGYRVPTFLRSATELAVIARYQPFTSSNLTTDPYTLSVMFLAAPFPAESQQALGGFATAMDAFHVHQREIYWLCRGKTTQSLVDWPRLGKAIALPALTVRNATTVRKIAARACDNEMAITPEG